MMFKYFTLFTAMVFFPHSCAAECSSSIIVSNETASFCGRINYDTREDLEDVLNSTDINEFVINSTGGVVGVAIEVVELLNAHNIRVIVRGSCFSACAHYVLALADDLLIEPGTAIGFHNNPLGTWLLMTKSGIIEDPSDPYWFRIRIRAMRSLLAYRTRNVDPVLLIEPELRLETTCVYSLKTTVDEDGQERSTGFTVRARKAWWVPSRELLNELRGSAAAGWWPANIEDVWTTYSAQSIDVEQEQISFSEIDDLVGMSGLEEIDIPMCINSIGREYDEPNLID